LAVGIDGNTISVKDSLELFMTQTVFKRNGAYSWYSKEGKEENNRDRGNNTILDFIKDAVLVAIM
jgi:hypothetical protein